VSRLARFTLWLPLLLAAACDSGGGGGGGGIPTDPGAVTLQVTATPATIGVAGVADVTVRATRGGAPVAGLVVALGTTLGRLEVAALTTDAQGRATTRLRGDGTSGVARLTAQAPSAATVASAEVRIGLDRSIRITVQPGILAGSQVAMVTVVVFEPDGSPAPAGTVVNLAVTLGRLAATQLTLDGQGTARTTLGTDGQVGTSRLTASVGAVTATGDVELRPAYALSLQATPASISTSGSSTITVRVSALDPAARVGGVTVQLVTSLGRLAQSQLRTNGSGVASTLLSADGRIGTATVTAVLVDGAAAPETVAVTIR
jgi:hypothetical protein